MFDSSLHVIETLAAPGFRPGDPEPLRARKRLLTLGLLATAAVSLAWGGLYAAMGLGPAAWVGFGAAALQGGLYLVYRRSGRLEGPLAAHTVANLLLPFVDQALLGGLMASGCLGLWALVGPLTALVHERRRAWLWFAVFVGLLLASAATEARWAVHPATSPALAHWLLVLNLGGVLGILYFPLAYLNHLAMGLRERISQEGAAASLGQHRAERLAVHLLPPAVAALLQANASLVMDAYPQASFLVAGLTPLLPPPPGRRADPGAELGALFYALAAAHGLESVPCDDGLRLAVGNVPRDTSQALARAAEMALALRQVFAERAAEGGDLGGFGLRLGLHHGPAVAGIVGSGLRYEIWGHGQAVAGRLERLGRPGAILASGEARRRLEADYDFTANPSARLRGADEDDTWWLRGRLPGRPAWGVERGAPPPAFI